MRFRNGITVTFQRTQSVTDEWNNQIDGNWVTFAVVNHVGFDPGGSVQLEDGGRRGERTEPRLIGVPNSVDARDRDRVLLSGDDKPWEVVARPEKWETPFTGWSPGQVMHIKRVEG